MVRPLVLCILLLLILPSAIAVVQGDILYNSWVYPGDTFEREGVVYYAEKGNTLDRLLLYVDDEPFILRNHECKENTPIHEKYCINVSAYEDPEGYDDKIRYEHGEEIFGYKLEIRTLVPELTATRTIKPVDPELGKRSTITVTLENEGENAVEYIVYRENITPPLQLVTVDGHKEGDTYVYELPHLGPGRTQVFQYAVIPNDYVTTTIHPSISYAYENIKKQTDIKAMSITVAQPLSIARALSSTKASINEEVDYTLTLENEESSEMALSVAIDLPQGLELDEIDGFDFNEGKMLLTNDEPLAKQKARTLSFSFSAPKTGDYPFTVDIDASVNGKKISRFYSEKVTVTSEQLEPNIRFSKVQNKLHTGEPATIRVFLTNNDPINAYVNVEGAVTGDLLEENYTVSESSIAQQEERLIVELPIVGPSIEKAKTSTFTFAGRYETKDGEPFDFSKALTINLEPMNDYFDITQKVNATNATVGDTIHVEVTLKNRQDTYLFANAYETFSEQVPVVAGTTFAELSFDAEQERQVYIYEIRIPDDFSGDQLKITTKVYEQDESFPQIADTVIPIARPLTPEEIVELRNATGANETGTGTGDGTGNSGGLIEKEPNILQKAWNWIKGLFN